MTIHVVKTGESLYDISKMYDVSISLIVNVNGLKSPNVLIPGLSLYIPDNYLYNRIYQIKPGDTLWKLARRFDTSIEHIFTVNPRINPNQLFIGQKVIVPSPNQMSIETVGFIFPQANGKSFAALNEIANQLSYVAIIAYSFSENGDVYLEADDSVTLTQSKQINIKPLLMIRNFKEKNFSAELVGKVFENSQSRQRLVTSLVNIIEQKGYEGVSIDFEFIPPPRRKDFISFLTE
ncbi:LysM peptidoglycan-binding domain-containing protein [Bacillus aquiflavi]|uniref:LysM peptidoglycan-binding domain-containing protein n=1 Tax=Bacillus aquiflavi TaxID=2672567 RepID=UPI00223C524A|nr:LysM peptidoglycan-binding domain-containing protein [Bacillus aquiflavi]